MDDRTSIGNQVWDIADKYAIPQSTVHSVISSYLAYCKDLLVSGERVDFLGLVSVVPNYISSDFSTTLAYNCSKIASRLSLPSHTVYRIMDAYVEDAIASVQQGITVEIRGIVVCTPIYVDGKISKVHSSISQSLKNILVGSETKVTSLRVHTYKSLKQKVKNSGVVI